METIKVGLSYSGPELMLDTGVGDVHVTFTNGHHCHVSANAGDGKGWVAYRGTQYYASVHLKLDDGKWQEMTEAGLHQFPVAHSIGSRTITPAGRKIIVEAIEAAVNDYVLHNPWVPALAEVSSTQRDRQRSAQSVLEAQGALQAAYQQLTEAQDAAHIAAYRYSHLAKAEGGVMLGESCPDCGGKIRSGSCRDCSYAPVALPHNVLCARDACPAHREAVSDANAG